MSKTPKNILKGLTQARARVGRFARGASDRRQAEAGPGQYRRRPKDRAETRQAESAADARRRRRAEPGLEHFAFGLTRPSS